MQYSHAENDCRNSALSVIRSIHYLVDHFFSFFFPSFGLNFLSNISCSTGRRSARSLRARSLSTRVNLDKLCAKMKNMAAYNMQYLTKTYTSFSSSRQFTIYDHLFVRKWLLYLQFVFALAENIGKRIVAKEYWQKNNGKKLNLNC